MSKFPRRAMLLACAAGISAALVGCGGAGRMSESQEIQVGNDVARQIESQYRTYRDPMVTRVGQQLAAASERPGLPWEFEVIDRAEVNAVSLPGGKIYIFEGLMDRIRGDEGQLAGVLGHEVGHVAKRHAVRQMEREQWFGVGVEVLTGGQGTPAQVARIAANLQLLHYSREQEYESDDAAIRYMRKTGHNPEGLVRLLQTLAASGNSNGISWLRTHPTSAARIERARRQVQQGG